jgi:hypothetical protein
MTPLAHKKVQAWAQWCLWLWCEEEGGEVMMMVHVVTSFDFGNTSNVKLHAVTEDADLAQEVYASVLAVCDENNSKAHPATMMMVELTHAPKDTRLLGSDALTLFWGGGGSAQNNNNNR